jgi:cellulose synthase/poly-beta-1,6-N-acetylglucosamine synthase-like glycosyltransferase
VIESERVFRDRDTFVFAVLTVMGVVAIGRFLGFWFGTGAGGHPVLFVIASGLLLFGLFNQQSRWFLLPSMRRPRFVAPPPGLRVAVVTTYVPGAEPLELIEHALKALVAIRYPHDTWLLDEGNDPAARALCQRLGVRHFSRRDIARYQASEGAFRSATKHGNYNAWLHDAGHEAYDILSAFDADHVPHREYLDQLLGYFRDPSVGYVQPAQAYYNQRASFIAAGAAEDTYAYFSMVQMASFAMGFPIVVGGHNLHRLSALEDVGGFAAHDADDLLLTLRYRNAGWRGVYVPQILARGLTPVDWRSYLGQQRRWARAIMDIKLREWRRGSGKLGLRTRVISVMQGANFILRGIVGLLLYLLVIGSLLSGGTPGTMSGVLLVPAAMLFVALGLQEFFRQGFYLDPRTERGLHWRLSLLWYAKWPWILFALLDVATKRRLPYLVTAKAGTHARYRAFMATHAALALALFAAWHVAELLHRHATPITLVTAGVLFSASVLLALSALSGFPPSFDLKLWRPVSDPVSG